MKFVLSFFLVLTFYYTNLSPRRDRFITVVNVVGDAMGTGIVEHLSRDELNKPQENNNNPRETHFTEKFLDNDEPDARLMTTGV